MRGLGLLSLAFLVATSTTAGQEPSAPAAGAASRPDLPPAFATRQLDLEIPFQVTAGTDPSVQATAVKVLVSWDFGRNWHEYTQVPADAGKFRFRAKKDAEFWFVTQIVDGASRDQQPQRPQLRLVIDTQKPDLKATAALNPTGQVEITWSVSDPHLIAQTLVIEYQDARGDESAWEPLKLSPASQTPSRGGLAGRIAVAPPEGMRTMNVRAEVADAAGNKTYFSQQLAIPLAHERERTQVVSPLAMDPGVRRWPSSNDLSPGLPRGGIETIARPAEPSNPGAGDIVANPHFRRDRLTASGSKPPATGAEELLPPRQGSEDLPRPANDSSLDDAAPQESSVPRLSSPQKESAETSDSQSLPPPSDRPAPGEVSEKRHRPLRTIKDDGIGPIQDEAILPAPDPTEDLPAPTASAAPSVTTTDSIPAGTRPRLTNTKRFTLDYDVESVGPEGIAEVELWGTTDGGQTWLKWGVDPDRTSPMDVEVASEATYGFRIVILGKNGLEGNKPASGDDADIWVSIDTTQPAARITAAGYGTGENAGRLDIRWEASDANLSPRPITLLYSDQRDGKYSIVAAGLENSGQYVWQFDPRSPRNIYLRLEVRDEAGNVSTDQLTDAISIEGLIPKGRIRSLTPAPETLGPAGGAFRSPLFR